MKGVLEETYINFWVEEDAREDGTGGWWSGRFCMRESVSRVSIVVEILFCCCL